MRTTLEPKRIQCWQTVGLSMWHRMILRQEAEASAKKYTSETRNETASQWVSCDDLASLATREVMNRIDIIVIEKEALAKADVATLFQFCDLLDRQHLALLWDWSVLGNLNHPRASILGLAGVVHDCRSLRSWSQVAASRGRYRMMETHPILSKIELPQAY